MSHYLQIMPWLGLKHLAHEPWGTFKIQTVTRETIRRDFWRQFIIFPIALLHGLVWLFPRRAYWKLSSLVPCPEPSWWYNKIKLIDQLIYWLIALILPCFPPFIVPIILQALAETECWPMKSVLSLPDTEGDTSYHVWILESLHLLCRTGTSPFPSLALTFIPCSAFCLLFLSSLNGCPLWSFKLVFNCIVLLEAYRKLYYFSRILGPYKRDLLDSWTEEKEFKNTTAPQNTVETAFNLWPKDSLSCPPHSLRYESFFSWTNHWRSGSLISTAPWPSITVMAYNEILAK